MAYASNTLVKKNKTDTAHRCYFFYGIGRPIRAGAINNLCRTTRCAANTFNYPANVGCAGHFHRAGA